jgi:hypothetical protein
MMAEIRRHAGPIYSVEKLVPGLTPVADSVYSEQLDVGRGGLSVPLTIRWTVGEDSTRCRRIASIRVERAGGDQGVGISNVNHIPLECGMRWESDDTSRFESAALSLAYEGRVQGRSFNFRGRVAELRGNGEL